MRFRVGFIVAIGVAAAGCLAEETSREVGPELEAALADAEARVKADASDLRAVLDRGDALFYLGRYAEAVRDYDRMIELDPSVGPTHWQRGLALHFAGRYEEAAKQFERFYERDKSDRENGIWRYYAQVEKDGVEAARKALLPYVEPDREPLPLVYRMCAGEVTGEEVLKSVEAAKVSAEERAKRQFYADLYVGLDEAIVRDDPKAAKPLLERAVKSTWPRGNGYGPNFMWHIARLSLEGAEKAKP
jgi:lipoprotein NlpI